MLYTFTEARCMCHNLWLLSVCALLSVGLPSQLLGIDHSLLSIGFSDLQ